MIMNIDLDKEVKDIVMLLNSNKYDYRLIQKIAICKEWMEDKGIEIPLIGNEMRFIIMVINKHNIMSNFSIDEICDIVLEEVKTKYSNIIEIKY